MKIAFYAPMKPPDHPVMSGDRTFARAILAALEALGHEVEVVSRFRSWCRAPAEQVALAQAAEAEREAVRARLEAAPPDLWLTYHLYHKAPDWLGPAISAELGIPYVVIEASFAEKQRSGRWREGAAAAEAALAKASMVAAIQSEDLCGLRKTVPQARLTHLTPFMELGSFLRTESNRDSGPLRLLSVGMMRAGSKASTYQALAKALAAWGETQWTLTVAGDGPERSALEPLFAADKTRFIGAVPPDAMPALYAAADIFVWPALKEPLGFVFLEAMASGLPIIGGRGGGVPDLVQDGVNGLLVEPQEPQSVSAALSRLGDPQLRVRMGAAGRQIAAEKHSLEAGMKGLAALIERAFTTPRGED
ncbi:glycosyltransferase involved in cell wall biosynthesis [Rhodopseudomonas julia]|uniref:Glycosyltransferase involved in cell wall biosynthesis n=1 Tax=Rhodopseudomonas julia TaxID=200617 RepID=A0ABU0C2A6_9BRAD|nr:glycosyltransferase family 4 protein [Rhodopseudomonas julia]MDQ0324645.1 glycosyltransferase involved in cell wall biosynthesis [Rhodopseudomonas julia]